MLYDGLALYLLPKRLANPMCTRSPILMFWNDRKSQGQKIVVGMVICQSSSDQADWDWNEMFRFPGCMNCVWTQYYERLRAYEEATSPKVVVAYGGHTCHLMGNSTSSEDHIANPKQWWLTALKEMDWLLMTFFPHDHWKDLRLHPFFVGLVNFFICICTCTFFLWK